eukprot:Em0056g8a
MDDAMLAVASQQTLSLFITEEQLVLEQAAVVCCLALVTCECHWLCKLYNTFVGTGRDGSIQQLSSLPLLLRLTVKNVGTQAHFNFSKINRASSRMCVDITPQKCYVKSYFQISHCVT